MRILLIRNRKIFFLEKKYLFNPLYVQKKSFSNFIESNYLRYGFGLKKILDKLLLNNNNIKINILGYSFRKDIRYNICKFRNITYCYNFFLKLCISFFTNGLCKERIFFNFNFCSLPYITERGEFLINGIIRVVVSQYRKFPGIYFNIDNNNQRIINIVSTKNIISIGIDKAVIYFKLNNTPRYPIYDLFKILNIDSKLVLNSLLKFHKIYINSNGLYIQLNTGMVNKKNYYDLYYNNLLVLKKDICLKYKEYLLFKNKYLQINKPKYNFIISRSFYLYGVKFNKNDRLNIKKVIYLTNKFKFEGYFSVNVFTIQSKYNNDIILNNFYINKAKYKYSTKNIEDIKEIFNDLNIVFSLVNDDKGFFRKLNIKVNNFSVIEIIKVLLDNNVNFFNNIDCLTNKKIKSLGAVIEELLRNFLLNYRHSIYTKLINFKYRKFLKSLFNTSMINSLFKEFFCVSQLSQFLDQTNPLSDLTHKRKITSLSSDNIKKCRAGYKLRDIHISQFGKICPIETPEGPNIGLVNSFSLFSFIDKYCILRTPYFRYINGFFSRKMFFLSAVDEIKKKLAQIDCVDTNLSISNDIVYCRSNNNIIPISKNNIEYINISFIQVFSLATILIPFLEHNDSNRALMGSNMQRQSLPCLVKMTPIIITGYDKNVVLYSYSSLFLKNKSLVLYLDNNIIILKIFFRKFFRVLVLFLKKNIKSNQDLLINYIPCLSRNQLIKKKKIISENNNSFKRDFCFGQNILAAYLPYKGFNFEDSIIISKRLLDSDIFTSIHIKEIECLIKNTRHGAEFTSKNNFYLPINYCNNLNSFGIIRTGIRVKGNDILVSKLIPTGKRFILPEENILYAIFNDKNSNYVDRSVRLTHNITGIISNIKIIEKNKIILIKNNKIFKKRKYINYSNYISYYFNECLYYLNNIKLLKRCICTVGFIKFSRFILKKNKSCINCIYKYISYINNRLSKIKCKYNNNNISSSLGVNILKKIVITIISKRKIEVGDKMSGRHGNKGVVSKILETNEMPYLVDGTICDMILNPLSIHSRMNLGQLYELHWGYLMFLLKRKMKNLIDSNRYLELKYLLRNFYFALEKYNQYKNILCNRFYLDIDRISLVFPTFNGFDITKLNYIINLVNGSIEKKVYLYDGISGKRYLKRVSFGYLYYLKLNHLSSDKIHSRSVGPYSLITQQPLKGKSNFGGQRFGEMEVWALEAYGVAYTIQEMLTIKSDDIYGRKTVYKKLLYDSNDICISVPESFKILEKEIRSLGISISTYE